ncbi:MAG: Asp23/Gls24 family envelope stress response protein [Catonella sp.]|uniref:Asp23/Gls24 family envelope stress response protein n=1 Tax=Catonella sp. TaxID=2382125 RepID=UPI003F9EF305
MNTNEATKNIGEIYIADEVVSAIAGLAALEVEGVKAVAGRPSENFNSKNAYKKVKVQVAGAMVYVDMSVDIQYGYSIPKVTKQIQEKVITALQNMIGLTCKEVNIKVVVAPDAV